MQKQLWKNIALVREKSPLVQNITNYVVMNNTANALLAVGASPIMAHAHREVEEMVSIVNSLVINIGTLDEYWVRSLHLAIQRAKALNRPWVLDPVGAGSTSYRNEELEKIVRLCPTIIRGNASEILALAGRHTSSTKGVDSTHTSTEAVDAALVLNQQFGSVVCISGATDIIIDRDSVSKLTNGHPMMARVTGMGCTASALTGALVAVCPNDPMTATVSAMALLGVAGEIAAEKSNGPGSLQVAILDTLYTMEESEFTGRLKIS